MISSTTTKRAEEVAEKILKGNVHGIHESIWPGVEVPRAKPGVNSKKRSRDENDVDVKFLDNTIPTSLFVCIMVSMMTELRTPAANKHHTIKALYRIMSLGAGLAGHLPFNHLRVGDNGVITIGIYPDLKVAGNTLFTDRFFRRHVAKTWDRFAKMPSKPWIQTTTPLEGLCLTEFLAFALDPTLPKSLGQALKPRALALMGVFAHLLDTEICPRLPLVSDSTRVFARKRCRAEVTSCQWQAAEMLWAHEGTHANVTLFIYVLPCCSNLFFGVKCFMIKDVSALLVEPMWLRQAYHQINSNNICSGL